MESFQQLLVNVATEPYRAVSRFAWHFARGKLSQDPVFTQLLKRGLIPDGARVLDLGCGQGLLAAWLVAARRLFENKQWDTNWSAPPRLQALRGVELMPRDVDRARLALGNRAEFVVGDIQSTDFGKADVVVILDVLHYIDIAAQDAVLRRVRDALAPGGTLILRVGDADGGFPFHFSKWVDHVVMFIRGHRLAALYCRPLSTWKEILAQLGFVVEAQPMSQGTPFGNVLLIARLNAA